MSAPSVYAAIHAVASDFAEQGIPKSHTNVRDRYDYRSIDDVMGRLAPLLAKHRCASCRGSSSVRQASVWAKAMPS